MSQETTVDQHTADLFKNIFQRLKPGDEMTLAEWADKYRRLPSEGSAEPGRWRTSRTPYLKRIMECTTDPRVREIIMMSGVQVGKSEVLLNAMGFYSHKKPTPMLMVQPTVKTGERFSKERIAPTIRDTPVLRAVFSPERSRDAQNTIMQKMYPGGYLAIVGANSPADLASRPVEVILADEIDRWPESAKSEGDPLTIVEKRTSTYPYTKKILKVSSPTIDGISRIQHEYNQGSMEAWKLPCPGCGSYQELKWPNMVLPRNEDGELDVGGEVLCACDSCGELNNEYLWKAGDGEWFAECENHTVKSFRLSALVSPWMSWMDICKEFWKSKGDSEMMKVWTNTILGEVFLVDGDSIDNEDLSEKRIKYDAMVPTGVILLTAGVDVQDDRFEVEVVGWGENKTSWGIEYKAIYGDTSLDATWEMLDQHLLKNYRCADGSMIPLASVCIDSGGHRTTETYRFCKSRAVRNIWAIKGVGGAGKSIIHGQSVTKKVRNTLIIVAVDVAKARLFSRLSLKDAEDVGYCYFPREDKYDRGYDDKYFEGLTSEVKTVRMVRGRPITEWKLKPGKRNEPLDCRVYNIAALEMRNPNFEELKKYKSSAPTTQKRRRGVVSRGVEV